MPKLTRGEYKERYVARLMNRGGLDKVDAEDYLENCAEADYDEYEEDASPMTPEDSADESMSYWDAD